MAIFNERLNAAQDLAVFQTVDSTTTGVINDYNAANISNIKFTGAVTSFRGLAGGVNGKIITLTNGYTSSFGILNQSGTSTAANRIITGVVADFAIFPDQTIALQYDGNSSRWRILNSTSNGGNILGRTNGASSGAGILGEVFSQVISTEVNAAGSGSFLPLATISPTPGLYYISATAIINRNGATLNGGSSWYICITPNSGFATGGTFGYDYITMPIGSLTTGNYVSTATIAGKVISLSATTPYYLNVAVAYTAGTPQWVGHLTAIRAD